VVQGIKSSHQGTSRRDQGNLSWPAIYPVICLPLHKRRRSLSVMILDYPAPATSVEQHGG
jgi:hypothetical protein